MGYQQIKEEWERLNNARSQAAEMLKGLGMARRQERRAWLDRHSKLGPAELVNAVRAAARDGSLLSGANGRDVAN